VFLPFSILVWWVNGRLVGFWLGGGSYLLGLALFGGSGGVGVGLAWLCVFSWGGVWGGGLGSGRGVSGRSLFFFFFFFVFFFFG